jgi:hypothetical protein
MGIMNTDAPTLFDRDEYNILSPSLVLKPQYISTPLSTNHQYNKQYTSPSPPLI